MDIIFFDPPREGEGYQAMPGGGDLETPCAGGGTPPPRAARAVPLPAPGRTVNGFTLVELMVVIVIIGLLATVVLINVAPATDKAAATKVRADISTLEQGVEMYRLSKLNYPSGDGLQALVGEGFVKRLPNDPWGNPYRYAAPGRNGQPFSIYSTGADGREGGEGENADIGNWE